MVTASAIATLVDLVGEDRVIIGVNWIYWPSAMGQNRSNGQIFQR